MILHVEIEMKSDRFIMKGEFKKMHGDATRSSKKHRGVFSVTCSLQYKFMAMTLIYGFIILSVFVTVIMAPDVAEMQNDTLSLEVRSSAASRVLKKNAWIWPAAIALLAVLGLHSFWEFQKVMGPLYRFRRTFEQVEKGHLISNVTTRKKDYLEGELAALNKMIAALGKNISLIRQETEASVKSIGELETAIEKNSEWDAAQIKLLQAHHQQIDRLADAVRFFRLPDKPQETTGIKQDTSEFRYEIFKNDEKLQSSIAGGSQALEQ